MPRCCIGTAVMRSGTGVQTVTAITDRLGTFTGKLVFFANCNAPANTLTYQTAVNNAYIDNRGADNGVTGGAFSLGDITRFFAKFVSGGAANHYSLVDYQADVFFGGNFQGYSYVSAFRDGEFDLTWVLNNRGGTNLFTYAVFGGDDLDIATAWGLSNGTYTTPSRPAGIFNMGLTQALSSSFGTVTGSGGAYLGFGWDARDSNRGSVVYKVINQGSNARGYVTDRCGASINDVPAVETLAPAVTTWSDLSYTITGNASTVTYGAFAFCGDGIVTKADTFKQPLAPGLQQIALDIDARFIFLASADVPDGSTFVAGQAAFCQGWTDGTNQACQWVGETADHNQDPLGGARYISDDTILRFGTATGATTTFDAVAEFVSFDIATGILTLNWLSVSGDAPTISWFAVGTPFAPPPSIGLLLTQLPLAVAAPYGVINALKTTTAWNTPPPTRSRRGR